MSKHWPATEDTYEYRSTWITQQLAVLALKKPPSIDDMSKKAKTLRFCLWVTCSRKEDSLPDALPNLNAATDAVRIDHSLLPEGLLGDSCAACGKEGATMRCTRCLIKNGASCSHETIRTLYCDRQCQVQHWPKHKAECAQLMQLNRIVKLYEEEAKAFFELFILRFRPKNIATTVCHMAPDCVEISGQAGHDVMVLALSSGREIVFDPTRAQFGWKEALTPWESYLKHRISTTHSEPPPMCTELAREVPGQIFQDRRRDDLRNANLVLAEVVAQKIASLLGKRYGRVENALKLSEKEFLPLRAAVAASMKRGLTFVAREMDGNTSESLPFASRNPLPAGTEEFCSTATMIWVQKAKYSLDKIMRGQVPRGFNMTTLLTAWEERFESEVRLQL
ncbi:hypothetical protein B0T21DRAFT_440479 [Apiosordaria backusii]|uniref:MYND-type domain-containing protein n=1 Tax=Apiosordaria backusii TaxID=314023 RepID=A0AA40BL90_9PEZI|nr:hypothetical protein B0T21DRAFT_440479 [Apiosordaria backusii]